MSDHYQTTKEFFDKVASEKRGYFDSPKSIPFLVQQRLRGKALKWAKGYQPERILDAGCGRGDFSFILTEYFPNAVVEGIDFSNEMINLAKQVYGHDENLKFSQAGLLRMPFEDKSFDLTFCLDALHHIYHGDLEKLISEITRVTRTAVIIELKNRKTIFWPLYEFLFKRANPGIKLSGTVQERLVVLFEKNNFFLEKFFPIFKFKLLSPNILIKFTAPQK